MLQDAVEDDVGRTLCIDYKTGARVLQLLISCVTELPRSRVVGEGLGLLLQPLCRGIRADPQQKPKTRLGGRRTHQSPEPGVCTRPREAIRQAQFAIEHVPIAQHSIRTTLVPSKCQAEEEQGIDLGKEKPSPRNEAGAKSPRPAL